jgi:hypothetical protein
LLGSELFVPTDNITVVLIEIRRLNAVVVHLWDWAVRRPSRCVRIVGSV